jgi:hypothetical protein
MPSLNFKARFAPLVENQGKRQSIRRPRLRPIRPGDLLYLYTGMRTAACRRLGIGRCTETQGIEIWADGILLAGVALSPQDSLALAEADGFASVAEFLDFFRSVHGLPFTGTLLRWEPLPAPRAP